MSTLRALFEEQGRELARTLPNVDLPAEMLSVVWSPATKLFLTMSHKLSREDVRMIDAALDLMKAKGTAHVAELFLSIGLAKMSDAELEAFAGHLLRFADLCRSRLPAPVSGEPGRVLRADGDGQDDARRDVSTGASVCARA